VKGNESGKLLKYEQVHCRNRGFWKKMRATKGNNRKQVSQPANRNGKKRKKQTCSCCYRLADKGRSVAPIMWPRFTPPEVCRWKVGICPELIDPSATGTAWAASPLGCLLVHQAIGWCDSWVPCGLERRLAVWLHGQKERYAGDWWYRRWMKGQLWPRCLRSWWIGAIWFAAVAFDVSYERPQGLSNRCSARWINQGIGTKKPRGTQEQCGRKRKHCFLAGCQLYNWWWTV